MLQIINTIMKKPNTPLFNWLYIKCGNKTVGVEARGGYVATTYHNVINPTKQKQKSHAYPLRYNTIIYKLYKVFRIYNMIDWLCVA